MGKSVSSTRFIVLKKKCKIFCILASALLIFQFFKWKSYQSTREADDVSPLPTEPSITPWKYQSNFTFYVRLTTNKLWVSEYKDVLTWSMKMFVPIERAQLLVVLDGEKQVDRKLAKKLERYWPYPKICYRSPGKQTVYHKWGKSRMYWDMMYVDECTNITYVGFVDTDTLFTTLVTPDMLFEGGKPVIIAEFGQPLHQCWTVTTEAFLKKKEVLQCMSYFPVIVKTEHIKEMRMVLSREQGKPFDDIFRDSTNNTPGSFCLCQFCVMCNYLWYYHRDEYAWHLQMIPNGNWKGQNWQPEMVPVSYYDTEVKYWMKIPKPRPSIHLRYTIQDRGPLMGKHPEQFVIDNYIREGLCYSAGFDFCPMECRRWNASKIHRNLYSFEFNQWTWDDRCLTEQIKHYENVKKYVEEAISQKKSIFGMDSIDYLCQIIQFAKAQNLLPHLQNLFDSF